MAGHWKELRKRVWKEAAESVGLGTKERVIVALLIQAFIAIGIYLGTSNWQEAEYVRILTAAAPFALFPLLFAWKWVTLPNRMSEDAAALAPQKADAEKSRKIVEVITYFIQQASDRRTAFEQTGEDFYLQVFSAGWIEQVREYLRENVGQAAALKFMTAPPSGMRVSGRSVIGGAIWADLGAKIEALAAIAGDVERR